MDRRSFLKNTAAAASAVALSSCGLDKAGKNRGASAVKEPIAADMPLRAGIHGEKVSLLGYGCMRWPAAQEEINSLVDKALECGVNYFDTAPVYMKGTSETTTGIALSRHPRESYFIATKLSNFKSGNRSFEASKKMYLNSLKALQTDYIDYYLLHSVGGSREDFEERFISNGILDFLLKERDAGRIRNLGFSFHGDVKVFSWILSLNDKYHWDFVQIQMNYVDWKYATLANARGTNADYLYRELDHMGIPVVIMEPLLGGRLAKVPQHIVTKFQEREPGRSAASWAFRFCASFPRVLTVLSGMTYMEHLEDNLRTFCPLQPLSDEEKGWLLGIAETVARYPLVPCTGCDYCMPCPYGIDIPSLFAHYNKCVNEGFVNPNPEDPQYRRDRRKFLSSYNGDIDPARAADKCIGCGQCDGKCPQRIRIPGEIARIDQYVEKLRREG